jgi:hypothetical protein
MATQRKHEMGRGGLCICPKCGEVMPHLSGQRCITERCPECNARMVRKGSYHHKLVEEKRRKKETVYMGQ